MRGNDKKRTNLKNEIELITLAKRTKENKKIGNKLTSRKIRKIG